MLKMNVRCANAEPALNVKIERTIIKVFNVMNWGTEQPLIGRFINTKALGLNYVCASEARQRAHNTTNKSSPKRLRVGVELIRPCAEGKFCRFLKQDKQSLTLIFSI